ncbi:hypothetical protein JZO70_16995 [Enterococcus sp. 669A]|uniref:Uncharacterized protein n=1 Tax=Candidatus Enterococcus moelleringii TaxID=2815325 RepID=A0ABS3LFN9_9ENTE|nr:hypothetical protein [Enterococcus sp. 669A]MBO1307875.1 hypothetical protein [Enterococcus sp. 669A]
MKHYIWLAAIFAFITLIANLFFLIKDVGYCEREQLMKKNYLLWNGLAFITTLGWGALAISLYVIIQQQLHG